MSLLLPLGSLFSLKAGQLQGLQACRVRPNSYIYSIMSLVLHILYGKQMYNRKIMLRKYSCIGLAHLITWKFLIAFESIDLLQMCLIKIAPSHFCSSLKKKKIYSPFWAKIGILPQVSANTHKTPEHLTSHTMIQTFCR